MSSSNWTTPIIAQPLANCKRREGRCGDCGTEHGHGAMTHIATPEKLDGKAVKWMEQVSDDEYRR
jgi:hypothetical protein